MNSNGDVVKDVNTEKLRKVIVPSIKTRTTDISKDNYIDDGNKQEKFYEQICEIHNIDIFTKNVADMT
jgi:hypothetical protein